LILIIACIAEIRIVNRLTPRRLPPSESRSGPLSQLALASKLHLLDLKDLLRVKVLTEPADEDEGLGLVVCILLWVGTQWAVQVGMQAL
jgi:hypothetical protein